MTQETFDNLKRDHPEVVARMIWHQANQGKKEECSIKIDSRDTSVAFAWSKTFEGIPYWSKVMNGRVFPDTIIPYHLGDTIRIVRKNRVKEYIFFKWDFKALAVWCMTKNGWNLFHTGVGEPFRQHIMKLPIRDVVFKIKE